MIDLALLQDFLIEAGEHLTELESRLLQLETEPDRRDILNDTFRSIHTIKGGAEFVGLEMISELSHKLENLLDLLRQGQKQVNRDIIDTLIEGKDRIALLVEDLEQAQAEKTQIEDLVGRIVQLTDSPAGYNAEQPSGQEAEALAHKSLEEEEAKEAETVEVPAYEEEDDQELFDIFVGQLKENISFLKCQLEEPEASDNQREMLERCTDSIESLKSSANYMDYQQLVLLYKSWLAEIDRAKDELSKGHEVSFGFMKAYVDKIVKIFPQAGESELAMEGSVSAGKLEESLNVMEEPDALLLEEEVLTSADEPDALLLEEEVLASIDEPDALLLEKEVLASIDEPDALLLEEEALTPIDEPDALLLEEEVLASIDELEDTPSLQDATIPEMPRLASADRFDLALLQDFLIEAGEHLTELESHLLQLETEPDRRDILNDAFRSIHTIKGGAEFVGLEMISELSHKLENLLDLLRQGEKQVNRDIIDTLIEGKDRIALLVEDLEHAQAEKTQIEDLVGRIVQLTDSPAGYNAEQPSGQETVALAHKSLGEEEAKAAETVEVPAYEEEDDQELFDIFIGQLKENISFLKYQLEEPEASDNQHEMLERCTDSIESLKSSANYMDYQKLVLIYKSWLAEIDQAKEDLSEGHEVSFGFMKAYVDKIFKIFPQAGESELAMEGSVSAGKLEEAPVFDEQAVLGEAEESLNFLEESDVPLLEEADLDSAPEPDAPFLEEEILTSIDESFAPFLAEDLDSIQEPDAVAEASDSISADQKLFETLGKAFDASMGQASGTEFESLPGVVEEMLSVGDKPSAAKPPSGEAAQQAESVPTQREHADVASEAPLLPDVAGLADSVGEGANHEIVVEAEQRTPASPVDMGEINQRVADRRKSDSPGDRVRKQSVRVSADKIDSLMNQVGELVVSRAFFSQLSNEMKVLNQHLKEEIRLDQKQLKPVRTLSFRLGEAIVSLGRVANELQEGVMKVRMLPISQLFNRYPRLVRDLSHNTDKQVRLEIRGEETELDKMIIEEISDPLIHIIRNAVDHGIETPSERKNAGKPEIGTLTLEAYHESNHIVIEITDDGRGLNPDRIKTKALEKGFLSKEELNRTSDKELMRIIMAPGFSTAEKVSHTSGRGVGMDVVKKNIERLNGTIEIDSTPGVKTQMRIKIPLTLAIIQALMVRVETELYTIPLSAVEQILRISKAETSVMEGVEVIHMRNRTMPIFRLSDMFGLTPDKRNDDRSYVVIVSTGMQQIGLVVDELVGQEEVVIKPLVDYLQENSGFSGATIIRDGKISLILDVYELVNMTIGMQTKRHQDQSLKRVMAASDAASYPAQAPANA